MTVGQASRLGSGWCCGVVALTLLFGLCTIFAGVVIAAQAWQEHWPEVTACAGGSPKCFAPTNRNSERSICVLLCEKNGWPTRLGGTLVPRVQAVKSISYGEQRVALRHWRCKPVAAFRRRDRNR